MRARRTVDLRERKLKVRCSDQLSAGAREKVARDPVRRLSRSAGDLPASLEGRDAWLRTETRGQLRCRRGARRHRRRVRESVRFNEGVDGLVADDTGKVLVAANGRTLYLFTADKGGKSDCSGKCTSVWPPLSQPARRAVRA
jgi:hypothetical protein